MRERKVKSLSHVQLLETPWTAAHQAPPSMGFSRQEYWSGLPLPSLEGLRDEANFSNEESPSEDDQKSLKYSGGQSH